MPESTPYFAMVVFTRIVSGVYQPSSAAKGFDLAFAVDVGLAKS